jgi:protein-S-isoprenylcysteine O-methyltransferase Ste14
VSPEPVRFAPSVSTAAGLFIWAGALLFAVSLAWLLGSYFVLWPRLESVAGRAAIPALWDVALFSLFALHHSVFARETVRVGMDRRWPGRERSIFVWTASLLLLGVCGAWRGVPGVAWAVTGPAVWVVYGLRAWGIVLTARSAGIIDVWELAGVRPARHAPGARGGSETFTTRGPYGWVRHPIYSGWFLVVFAVPTMTMTQLVFAVVSSAYLIVGIVFEERSLVRAAPEAYRAYQERVRWKVVPGIY